MKKNISLIYKILIVIMSFIGLYLNFKISSFRENIVYFTIQSNLLCFIFYLVIVILKLTNKLKKSDLYYITKGMVTMSITLTMLVYQMVLSTSGTMDVYENNILACNFVHLIVPLMVILDYVIFGEKGHLKKNYPFIWSIVLVLYIMFLIIYILLGGTFMDGNKYPYYFMNIEQLGLFRVFISNLVLYVFFILCGLFVQKLDNYFSKSRI